jgi:hypothetical protein
MSSNKAIRTFFAAEALLLAVSLVLATLVSQASEWDPLWLVVLLGALSLGGQGLQFTIRGQNLSAGFVAQVLAMSLLGPAPAVAIALLAAIFISARPRRRIGSGTCRASPSVRWSAG